MGLEPLFGRDDVIEFTEALNRYGAPLVARSLQN